jgi:hypothetical protein
MKLSREAKLVSGAILLVVPTIMYGGITLLGILTEGVAGRLPVGFLWMKPSGRCGVQGTLMQGFG